MIPICEPTLKGNELKYVIESIKSNWISSQGKYISLFERAFSEYCNARYGVACSSGTAALHLALAALKIGKGDEVIIPTFTMIATANAVVYTGAKPVFVDSEFETWNINASRIEEKITRKTKAIIAMHTYGHPVNMDGIQEIAKKHNLYVIEDAAEAHGAEYKGRKVGSLGDIACFSFYGNKIVTTGEGGMVVTNNKKFAERVKLLRNHSFTKPRFLHHELGFNYRMTNPQAAVGLAQIEKIEKLVGARRKNAKFYTSLLKELNIITPPEASWAKNVYWMYGILLEESSKLNKKSIMSKLYKKGIETRDFFIPMHKQPIFQRIVGKNEKYPVADKLSNRGFCLPSSSSLKKTEIKTIANVLKEILK